MVKEMNGASVDTNHPLSQLVDQFSSFASFILSPEDMCIQLTKKQTSLAITMNPTSFVLGTFEIQHDRQLVIH